MLKNSVASNRPMVRIPLGARTWVKQTYAGQMELTMLFFSFCRQPPRYLHPMGRCLIKGSPEVQQGGGGRTTLLPRDHSSQFTLACLESLPRGRITCSTSTDSCQACRASTLPAPGQATVPLRPVVNTTPSNRQRLPCPKESLATTSKLARRSNHHATLQKIYGVEIVINSPANDWSQSWVVICRGIESYVTELSVDCKDPLCNDTQELRSTGRLDAYLHWSAEPRRPAYQSKNACKIPVEERQWVTIPCVEKVWHSCRGVTSLKFEIKMMVQSRRKHCIP